MEYDFYLEQKYLYEGRVEARILTAAQVEVMGYEDGYRSSHTDHRLYVDGFYSTKWLKELIVCIVYLRPSRSITTS